MTEPVRSSTLAGLMSRIRRGQRGEPDLEARLSAAFAKHEPRLRALCRGELRGLSEAQIEEVVQDVLLEAWSKLDQYKFDERPFRAYLAGIARMKCANCRRKARDLFLEDLDMAEPESSVRDALRLLTDQERDQLISDASKAVLDDKEQAVIHLRWVLDYSQEDIALQLGLKGPDEVRVTLQRCRRRMEQEVERRLRERGHGASFLRS